jgi:hypothetical protein
MQPRAKLYIGSFYIGGVACFVYAMAHWSCADPLHYLCHLATALIASGLKVPLPGIQSTLSVSYVFVVASMVEFSYPETAVVACLAMAAQSLWRTRRRPRALQVGFNFATMNIAVSIAYGVYHVLSVNGQTLPIRVAVAAICYFLVNTVSIAGVIAVTEDRNLRKIWNECYFWSFPYYLVGGE